MSRLWVLCALVSACIYTDPINQRPSVGIVRDEPTGEIHRGSEVKLHAEHHDPEDQVVFFSWRAYACTDATPQESGARPGCDALPFFSGLLEDADFMVPNKRVDVDVPVSQVIVLLQAQDDFGATSKPTQELLLSISNAPPGVVLRKEQRSGYVEKHPIKLYGKITDPDDGPLVPTLEWTVFSPETQPAYDLVDLDAEQDPEHPEELQVGKTFTPMGIGDWEIQLVATDPLGETFMDHVMISVVPDHAPCIAQVAPIVAPAGSALPLTEPTLFQVNVVTDDLDPFPATPDPELGTARFNWKILQPGASGWEDLDAVDGNAVPLDPANYAPGEIVELRVEIKDRTDTDINCADSAPTCSVISDNACIQRQTWRVEVH